MCHVLAYVFKRLLMDYIQIYGAIQMYLLLLLLVKLTTLETILLVFFA